jgi:excisionase family DNA binding protein
MTDESAWPELMTVAEVAVILRVSKMTVYRMVREGEIEVRRVGRSYRLLADSVRDYIRPPALPAPEPASAEPAASWGALAPEPASAE